MSPPDVIAELVERFEESCAPLRRVTSRVAAGGNGR